jgi:hypothetical protein
MTKYDPIHHIEFNFGQSFQEEDHLYYHKEIKNEA